MAPDHATAVDSGTASDTVGELVAVLAQRRWTEEEKTVLAPWYRPCSRTREEAKMIDPVGGAANCSVHEGRGHKKIVCALLRRQCSRRTTESRPI